MFLHYNVTLLDRLMITQFMVDQRQVDNTVMYLSIYVSKTNLEWYKYRDEMSFVFQCYNIYVTKQMAGL